MSRVLMRPLLLEDGSSLRCAHEKIWPPPHLHLIPDEYGLDVEYLRFRIPDETYLRIKTWSGVCGLLKMKEEKCKTCPHSVGEKKVQEPVDRVRPVVRTSPVARTLASPGRERRPGVPQNARVSEFLTLEKKTSRIKKDDPDYPSFLQKMEDLKRSMNPSELRQLQVIRGKA